MAVFADGHAFFVVFSIYILFDSNLNEGFRLVGMNAKHALAWSIFISLVLIIGLGYWQFTLVENARVETAAVVKSLQDEISRQSADLLALDNDFRVSELNTNDALRQTQESLQRLGQDIDLVSQESKLQVNQLTGELNSLKLENDEKFSELEDKLTVNLKSSDFSGLVQDVIKSVVSVQTDKSVGSGVFVHSDGFIVTNYHVINGASAGFVRTFDGKKHKFAIVGYDVALDIAVLQIEGVYKRLKFGNSDNVDIGQRVIAMGSPAGLEFSVNEGIISAKRTIGGIDYLQTDVALNPGNSGGPLVDASGKVVGINNFKLSGYEGLNFAIASNEAKVAVDRIIGD